MAWDSEALEARIIRHDEQIPCKNAFLDTKTPGSDEKENFCLIGPGVSERHDQHVHIREPHGFNIGAARQPKGCVNSQHSHETAEMFVVHEGEWKFTWGHDAPDGGIILGPGDTISIPVNVFRGFEYVGEGKGYLFGILGGDDPGFVTWAPYVFEQAKDYGLILLADNTLIDVSAGEIVPEGATVAEPTRIADIKNFRTLSHEETMECIMLAKDTKSYVQAASEVSKRSEGVEEVAIIGGECPAEGLSAGKMAWDHGCQVRRWCLAPGAKIPTHTRAEEEVVFVHKGSVDAVSPEGSVSVNIGDTMTVPKGMLRHYENSGSEEALLYIVRRGSRPAAPEWFN